MRRLLPAVLCLLAPFAALAQSARVPAGPTRLAPPPAPKVEWKPVYYKGRSYVAVDQVAAYYDLKSPEIFAKTFVLMRDRLTIELTQGEKRMKLSGWTFYFSFPVIKPKDVPMISVFDVRNVLDPILRPNDRRDPSILRTVVIDPAGGGSETGIKSPFVAEKDLTLETAKLLAPLLKASGYKVVLTRQEDKSVMPGLRVRTANDVTEEAIFLSLRGASSTATSAKGFECSTLPPAGTPATNEEDSPNIDKRFFAGNISDRESLALATTVQNSVVREASAIDLGIRRVRVEELRDVRMPAISCKLGYLSNKEEAKKLATNEYRAQLAAAIVRGVDRYAEFLRKDMEIRSEEDRKRPLHFGPITVKQEAAALNLAGEKVALRLPMIASEAANIDRSRVELQVFMFESVNDGEIDLTTANPPEINWISVLPDWKQGVPEWMQVSYLRPPFNALEEKQYGRRAYYGYVARLIYDGRLLDEASYPPNLNRCLYYFTPVFPRR